MTTKETQPQPHSFSFHPTPTSDYYEGFGSCSCGWLIRSARSSGPLGAPSLLTLTAKYRTHLEEEAARVTG